MKITVTFDVPDGTLVHFGEPGVDEWGAGDFVPPFADELVPLPDGAAPIPGDYGYGSAPTAFRAPTVNAPQGICPVHRVAWKVVPAGISKKSGKPYGAFAACPVRGCDQRPAA